MNPTKEILPLSPAGAIPEIPEQSPITWQEPYSSLIAENLDKFSDTIPKALLAVEALETYVTYYHGRRVAHPALKFSFDMQCRGRIGSIEPINGVLTDDQPAPKYSLTVARAMPLQQGERLPILIEGVHMITDITYPTTISDQALHNLMATTNRYNGPAKDRYRTEIV